MTETRIVLIRHGEAQTHVDKIVGGHKGCNGLSALGRRQAEALRDRLMRTEELAGAAAFYASVLPRAIETAEIIAKGVGDGSLDLVTSCDLCEQHPGEADMLSWEDANARYAEARRSDWFREDGESRAELQLRIGRALDDLIAKHEGETVVIACHGGVIRSAFTALAPVAPEMWTRMSNTNTGITEWLRTEALPTDVFNAQANQWLLIRHNDAGHLARLAAS